ncbi:GNAT family N-acetyltransferase [Bacillus spizizenii]|nr:GNAT family N-acetyltransferase [Bacillus spizizenii]
MNRLAEEYWEKGFATESVRILVSFLFEKVNVNRRQAEVMPANEASKKRPLKNQYAVIKLGIWGSAVGLLINTVSLWSHPIIFPALSKGQAIAFARWMVCAYRMYLLIPLMFARQK